MKTGIELIAEERKRQIEVEGWTQEHDSTLLNGELALAGSVYAFAEDFRKYNSSDIVPFLWPFEKTSYKPSPNDRIQELKKAGALIAAEIDRINAIGE